jgi:hypothetical protein
MVAMATGMLVADSGLSRYSPQAYAANYCCGDACGGGGGKWKKVRLWKKMAASGLLKKGHTIGCGHVERNVGIDERQATRPEQERRHRAAWPE